jgi:hypothetical protein
MAKKKKNPSVKEIRKVIKAVEELYRNKAITGVYIKENIVFGFLVTLLNVEEHIEIFS